jgi:ABC-2 type transport system permease protein
MATNAELLPVRESGWRMGFANLLSKETGAWWRTRMWWIQALIWLAIMNGMVALMLWGVPQEEIASEAAAQAQTDAGAVDMDALMNARPTRGLTIFLIFGGIALPIAGLIVGQDALIEEKKSGTAAWVLSKPVSRESMVLTKLIAHSLGFLVVGVLLQGLVAYLQIRAAGGDLSVPRFLGALGLLYLNLLFYLTLTLMLGALFAGRGPVLGIAFGLLFGYQIFVGLANGLLAYAGPWALVVTTPITPQPLSVLVALGQPLPTVVPIIFTALWCVVFTAVAVWRFGREEF